MHKFYLVLIMKLTINPQFITRLFISIVIASSALFVLTPAPAQAIKEEYKSCFNGVDDSATLLPLPKFSLPQCQTYGVVVEFLKAITNTAIQFVLAIALIFLIITGYQFITSVGDKTGMENAKRSLLYIVIGILAVLGAFMIVSYIQGIFLTQPGP